jgi:hypothetical protein
LRPERLLLDAAVGHVIARRDVRRVDAITAAELAASEQHALAGRIEEHAANRPQERCCVLGVARTRKLPVRDDQGQRRIDVGVGGAAALAVAAAAIAPPVHQPARALTLIVVPQPVEGLLIAHIGRDHHAVTHAFRACVVVALGIADAQVAVRARLDQRLSPIEIQLTQLVRGQRIGGEPRADVAARERERPAEILRGGQAAAGQHEAAGGERQGNASRAGRGLEAIVGRSAGGALRRARVS